METAIQKLAILSFLVIGFSHVLQPRAWARLFIAIRGLGEAGSFIVAFMSLPLGVLIVSFHNLWSGWPIVVTLLGWGQLFKATLYFVYPKWGVRILSRISVERAHEFQVAGAAIIALSIGLALALMRRWVA